MKKDDKPQHLALAEDLIDTVITPLVVLNQDLTAVLASRSFYKEFSTKKEDVIGKKFYDLLQGQWNIPELRRLLQEILPQQIPFESYMVTHDFPGIGPKTLYISAKETKLADNRILVTITDITPLKKVEEQERIIMQKDVLLKEMRHRIANSLQLIASILLLKADEVTSDESRLHLEDAYERIMSIAKVQRNLDSVSGRAEVLIIDYLKILAESISGSMISKFTPVEIRVGGTPNAITSNDAIVMGLIVTELIMNSIKYAFPDHHVGTIWVHYVKEDGTWTLTVRDNGIGINAAKDRALHQPHHTGEHGGLGMSITKVLAEQLGARVEILSDEGGTSVAIIHND